MPEQFGAFTASELYCPKCKRAQPVREKLLLLLPSGELYEYLCSECATSLGQRTISGRPPVAPSAPPPPRERQPPSGTPRLLR